MRKFVVAALMVMMFAALTAAETAPGPRPKPVMQGAAPKYPDSLPQKRFEIRDSKNAIVTLETDLGKIVLELYRDVAPAHADSFLARCNDGFYSGTKFHRIMKTFMIQGGNPWPVGKKNVTYYLPNELNSLRHEFGTLSMASSNGPTTAQTQFFICTDRNPNTASLDGKYVAFGHVIKGFDVLWAISRTTVVATPDGRELSVPTKDIFVQKAYRSDAEGSPLK